MSKAEDTTDHVLSLLKKLSSQGHNICEILAKTQVGDKRTPEEIQAALDDREVARKVQQLKVDEFFKDLKQVFDEHKVRLDTRCIDYPDKDHIFQRDDWTFCVDLEDFEEFLGRE